MISTVFFGVQLYSFFLPSVLSFSLSFFLIESGMFIFQEISLRDITPYYQFIRKNRRRDKTILGLLFTNFLIKYPLLSTETMSCSTPSEFHFCWYSFIRSLAKQTKRSQSLVLSFIIFGHMSATSEKVLSAWAPNEDSHQSVCACAQSDQSSLPGWRNFAPLAI